MPIIEQNKGGGSGSGGTKGMKTLGEQWSEAMRELGKELDELPGRLAEAMERRLNFVRAVIALFAVLAVAIFFLGYFYGINKF